MFMSAKRVHNETRERAAYVYLGFYQLTNKPRSMLSRNNTNNTNVMAQITKLISHAGLLKLGKQSSTLQKRTAVARV